MKVLFSGMLIAMLTVTAIATLDRGMIDAGRELWPHWWFRATLADAYFAFITFFAWVAYKERRMWRRALWFVLIMGLGTIAMSSYVLIELFRRKPTESFADLLTRRDA